MKNIKKLFSYGRNSLVVFSICLSAITKAAVVDITAEYNPDISNPEHVDFRNTTPIVGFCSDYPHLCNDGMFSIYIPNVSINKRLTVKTDSPPDAVLGAKVDGQYRRVTLTEPLSGQMINAHFRLNLIDIDIYGNLMPGWWSHVNGGCNSRTGVNWATRYRVAWTVPESHTYCYKDYNLNSTIVDDVFEIRGVGVGYELKVDSPLGLISGNYEGELVYTLGNGADIDYYAITYSDHEIRFRISAKIEHAFTLQFPSGTNRIRLEPSGGWGQWFNSGRMPAKMERNVDFSLTTSGPISIALQCEQEMGTNCALRNQNTGEKVELETRVTLPGLKPLGGGAEVKDYRLATGPIKQFFIPEAYSYKRQSTVHFRVNQPHVETMLKQPGSQWAGNVTLIFEAGL